MMVSAATTFGRVPPRTTPALTVTPGHRPLSACNATILWAASRTALRPFSGSTPAWAARPVMRSSKSAMPLRELTMSPLARAPSITSATSTVAAWARDDGRAHRRPDLLVRVGHEHDASERQRPSARSMRSAYSPASRPPFMSETPGPMRDAVPDRERPLRHRARVEHGVHVADHQQRGPAAAGHPNVPTTVSPCASLGSTSTSAPRSRNAAATQRPTSSTPALVYEPQSMSTRRWRSAR